MAVSIAPMTGDDFDFAIALTDAENWMYLRSDFERLAALAPDGCFVARGAIRRVGIISTTRHADYGFMGTLIVEASHRRGGTGAALFEHAMNYLRDKGVETIELDGVFAAVSMYRRFGFRDKYLSLRFVRPSSPIVATSAPLLQATVDNILSYDRERLQADRSAVLSRFCDDFHDSLFAIGDQRLSAYAFVKPRADDSVAIGPLVADDPERARILLKSIIGRFAGRTISIGVPEGKTSFVQTLMAEGFLYRAPSLRMYSGRYRNLEEHVFGIISADKG